MNLKTKLMQHQQQAFDKLRDIQLNALFMDMGTGKTRTCIEFVKYRLDQNRINKVVIFCPVSVKNTFYNEIIKHTDCNSIYVFDNKTDTSNIPESLFYIVGIESMSSSHRIILTVNNIVDDKTMIVVDESSFIKGHDSKRTKYITLIGEKTKYKMIMTGTPVSQGIVDLFSQFKFLNSKILGYRSFYSFSANHLKYSDKYKGLIVETLNEEEIADSIAPFTYQVTKNECLDLPSKTYQQYYVYMDEKQRELYEKTKCEMLDQLDDSDFDFYIIMSLFCYLRQIASGFLYSKNKYNMGWKLEKLLDILSIIPKESKVVIWCQYKNDIDIISSKIDCCIYHGELSEKQRKKELNKFNEKRYFLGMSSVGGFGLNELIGAEYVIFYNNSFKYLERLQAEDRTHRIGTTKSVHYIDIICADSIDERIYKAISNKMSVAESFKNELNQCKDKKRLIKNL